MNRPQVSILNVNALFYAVVISHLASFQECGVLELRMFDYLPQCIQQFFWIVLHSNTAIARYLMNSESETQYWHELSFLANICDEPSSFGFRNGMANQESVNRVTLCAAQCGISVIRLIHYVSGTLQKKGSYIH